MTTTTTDTSTGGAPAACGDGLAEPGEFCFGEVSTLTVNCPPTAVLASDVDGNGAQDIVYAAAEDGEIHVFLGNGDGAFVSGSADAVGGISNFSPIAFGHFNNDDDPDLVMIPTSGAARALLNDGNGTINNGSFDETLAIGDALTTGDLNGDGYDDIVVVSNGNNGLRTVLAASNGSGSFEGVMEMNPPNTIRVGVVVVELNGNENADIAFTNVTTNEVSACLGDGAGGVASCSQHSVDTWPVKIAAGDINGDGRQDLATANNIAGTVSWLPGLGNGGFEEARTLEAAGSVNEVLIEDLDLDGDGDLVYIDPSAAAIVVRLYDADADAMSEPQVWTYGSGRMAGLATADFNADGLPDLVAGNAEEATLTIVLSDA